eukprot:Rmarinus@m.26358
MKLLGCVKKPEQIPIEHVRLSRHKINGHVQIGLVTSDGLELWEFHSEDAGYVFRVRLTAPSDFRIDFEFLPGTDALVVVGSRPKAGIAQVVYLDDVHMGSSMSLGKCQAKFLAPPNLRSGKWTSYPPPMRQVVVGFIPKKPARDSTLGGSPALTHESTPPRKKRKRSLLEDAAGPNGVANEIGNEGSRPPEQHAAAGAEQPWGGWEGEWSVAVLTEREKLLVFSSTSLFRNVDVETKLSLPSSLGDRLSMEQVQFIGNILVVAGAGFVVAWDWKLPRLLAATNHGSPYVPRAFVPVPLAHGLSQDQVRLTQEEVRSRTRINSQKQNSKQQSRARVPLGRPYHYNKNDNKNIHTQKLRRMAAADKGNEERKFPHAHAYSPNKDGGPDFPLGNKGSCSQKLFTPDTPDLDPDRPHGVFLLSVRRADPSHFGSRSEGGEGSGEGSPLMSDEGSVSYTPVSRPAAPSHRCLKTLVVRSPSLSLELPETVPLPYSLSQDTCPGDAEAVVGQLTVESMPDSPPPPPPESPPPPTLPPGRVSLTLPSTLGIDTLDLLEDDHCVTQELEMALDRADAVTAQPLEPRPQSPHSTFPPVSNIISQSPYISDPRPQPPVRNRHHIHVNCLAGSDSSDAGCALTPKSGREPVIGETLFLPETALSPHSDDEKVHLVPETLLPSQDNASTVLPDAISLGSQDETVVPHSDHNEHMACQDTRPPSSAHSEGRCRAVPSQDYTSGSETQVPEGAVRVDDEDSLPSTPSFDRVHGGSAGMTQHTAALPKSKSRPAIEVVLQFLQFVFPEGEPQSPPSRRTPSAIECNGLPSPSVYQHARSRGGLREKRKACRGVRERSRSPDISGEGTPVGDVLIHTLKTYDLPDEAEATSDPRHCRVQCGLRHFLLSYDSHVTGSPNRRREVDPFSAGGQAKRECGDQLSESLFREDESRTRGAFLIHLHTGRMLARCDANAHVSSISLSPESGVMATGTQNGHVHLYS